MTTTVILEEKQKRKEANIVTFKFLLADAWRKFKRTNVISNLLFAGIIIITSLLVSKIDNLSRKNEVKKGNLLINTKFENNLKSESEIKIQKEETDEIKQEEVKTKTNETVYLMVNINSASSEMLQSLNGIGASYAEKIIEYRNTNGPFKSIDEIKNVKGIGDAKFNKIKKYIEV